MMTALISEVAGTTLFAYVIGALVNIVLNLDPENRLRKQKVCMYVCTYVCMFVPIYVCMYVCMYVCTYVCMFVFMYVCMYVCTYVYRLFENARFLDNSAAERALVESKHLHFRKTLSLSFSFSFSRPGLS